MTSDDTWFLNKHKDVKTINVAEKNRWIESKARGTSKMIEDGPQKNQLRLEDVLHVPDLSSNLISVANIVKKGNEVVFNDRGAFIFSRNGQLISKGEFDGNMFSLKLRPNFDCDDIDNVVCFKTDENDTELWHKRLGHVNLDHLKMMHKNEMVKGLNLLKGGTDKCESCIKGKMGRLPGCKVVTENVNDILERIHVDLCGPMRVTTLGGRRYMMVVVDQYSRRYFIELLCSKDEAAEKLKKFIYRREKETDKKVKCIRTDNGMEFMSNSLKHFLEMKGIKHEKTIPYSPRSNGMAERANRTLLDIARTMLLDSKLPLQFWGEAVATAAYLYYLTPCKEKSIKTPMEIWSGRKLSVRHLRIFGCLALYNIDNINRHKLEAKAKCGVMVGYSQERRAYRIYDYKERRVCETSDVRFIETKLGIPEEKVEEEKYWLELFYRKLSPKGKNKDVYYREKTEDENIETGDRESNVENEGIYESIQNRSTGKAKDGNMNTDIEAEC